MITQFWRESLQFAKHPEYPASSPLKPYPELFRYLPGSTWFSQYPDNKRGYFDKNNRVIYEMNSAGYRDREFNEKKKNIIRIASIGDSFSFGEGVKVGDRYSDILQKQLYINNKRVDVLNLGVNGHDIRDEYALLGENLEKFNPDLIIWEYLFNDISNLFLYYLLPKLQEKEKEYYVKDTPSVLLNYLQERNWQKVSADKYVQAILDVYNDPVYWDDLQGYIMAANEEIKAHGTRLLFIIFPSMDLFDQHHYKIAEVHRKMADLFSREDIHYLDLTPYFQKYNHPEKLWVHPTDGHPNDIANKIAAEAIMDYLNTHDLEF